MKNVLAIALLLFAASQARVLEASPPSFDEKQFNGLSIPEKQKFLIAVVGARNDNLQNCAFTISEHIIKSVAPPGESQVLRHNEFEMKRKDDKVWIHLLERRANDAIIGDGIANWTGTAGKSIAYPPYKGTNYPEGRIYNKLKEDYLLNGYNLILGTAVSATSPPVSLLEWLKTSFVEIKTTTEIIAEPVKSSAPQIRVTRIHGYRTQSYWLDSEKGFMPVCIAPVGIGECYHRA